MQTIGMRGKERRMPFFIFSISVFAHESEARTHELRLFTHGRTDGPRTCVRPSVRASFAPHLLKMEEGHLTRHVGENVHVFYFVSPARERCAPSYFPSPLIWVGRAPSSMKFQMSPIELKVPGSRAHVRSLKKEPRLRRGLRASRRASTRTKKRSMEIRACACVRPPMEHIDAHRPCLMYDPMVRPWVCPLPTWPPMVIVDLKSGHATP